MKHVLLAALIAFPMPSLAQDEGADGMSLMEQGARLFLEGLMTEAEPALDEMQDFAEEIGPAFRALAQELGPALGQLRDLMDEVGNYEAPEIMPNGDIIIRRSPDAPTYVPPEGEIEL